MNQLTDCPGIDTLRDLLLGRLEARAATPLEQHFDSCQRCVAAVESLPAEDVWVHALRGGPTELDPVDRPVINRLIVQARELRERMRGQSHGVCRSGKETLGPLACDTAAERAVGTSATTPRIDCLDPPQAEGELGRVGKFRVTRQIACGGMGVIFEAEDPHLERRVALKLILDSRVTDPHYLARFESEGSTLAALRHPNIVQIYEIGRHNDRPYIALEYIDGGSLAERLDGRPQPVHTSARLIETVARAVDYAHQQGVVHRDLKPANILLERDPRQPADVFDERVTPKISDFGLAKRLDQEGLTLAGDLLGTPGYVAPELTRGECLVTGASADVYSLGAILYELLTGRPPFRGETVLDTLEQARHADPVPPGRLRPGLPRDLETICLQCLEKEPARRYVRAADLADDLRRFLDDHPIRARRAGPVHRLTKWVKRRPALAALVLVALVGSAAAIVARVAHEQQLNRALTAAEMSAKEAREVSKRADQQYREARDTIHRMMEHVRDPSRRDLPRVRELRRAQQEEALRFFLGIAQHTPHGATPELREEVARAWLEAGRLEFELGQMDAARSSLTRAIDLYTELAQEDPNAAAYRSGLAASLNASAACWPPDVGVQQHARAVELRTQLVAEHPDSIEHLVALAESVHNRACSLFALGEYENAESRFREAASLLTELTRKEPDEHDYRRRLAKTHINLSVVLQADKERLDETRAFHDLAEQSLEQLTADDPNDYESLISLALLRVNWAYVLQTAGQIDSALNELAASIEPLQQVLAQEPSFHRARDALYRTHGVRAQLLEGAGRYSEAATEWQQVATYAPGPLQNDHRAAAALCLARAASHREAVEAVEAIVAGLPADAPATLLQTLALTLAIASDAARRNTVLDRQLSERFADEYAARAVQLLARIRAIGDTAVWQNVANTIAEQADWNPVRHHRDFEQLRSGGPPPKPTER